MPISIFITNMQQIILLFLMRSLFVSNYKQCILQFFNLKMKVLQFLAHMIYSHRKVMIGLYIYHLYSLYMHGLSPSLSSYISFFLNSFPLLLHTFSANRLIFILGMVHRISKHNSSNIFIKSFDLVFFFLSDKLLNTCR